MIINFQHQLRAQEDWNISFRFFMAQFVIKVISKYKPNTNGRTTFEIRISKGLSFYFIEYSVNLMANNLKLENYVYII